MITEDYVSFKTVKLLKEKGFDDEYTNAFYDKTGNLYFIDLLSDLSEYTDNDTDIAASTLYVAIKWLREKHKITIGILFEGDRIYYEIHQNNEFVFGVDTPESYEKVCDEAIKYCLKILI